MITGRQIRAARALLGISQDELATSAGLTKQGISKIEDSSVQPREGTMADILRVFSERGIEFTDNQGVRFKDDRVREIVGENCFAQLLDEIYYRLDAGEEFLVAWADETLSPEEVHESYRRIVKKGIKYRKLIQQGNNYICGGLNNYRCVEREFFQNATAVFFKDTSAYLTEDWSRVVMIKDGSLAKANKNFFEKVWASSTPANTTTSEVRYE